MSPDVIQTIAAGLVTGLTTGISVGGLAVYLYKRNWIHVDEALVSLRAAIFEVEKNLAVHAKETNRALAQKLDKEQYRNDIASLREAINAMGGKLDNLIMMIAKQRIERGSNE